MEDIMMFVEDYNTYVILGLGAGLIIMFLMYIISQVRISAITKKYNRLVKGVDGNNLEDILMQHIDSVEDVKDEIIKVKDDIEDIDRRLKLSVQKVGFLRYNAFNDMGSDLSFSVALLDDNINGFVITSIYGRDESNTYAKPILNGKSKYTLSVEEVQVIDMAIKGELPNYERIKTS